MAGLQTSGAGVLSRMVVRGAKWAAALVVAGSAMAQQPAGEAAEKAPETQTLIVIERGTCDDLFVSEKDSALKRALDMLPARLREFREQVPDLQNVPPEALELLISVFQRPARLAITNKGFDQQTGMPGIGAILSFKANEKGEEDAKSMHTRFDLVRSMANMPFEPGASKRFPGMTDLPLPMGVLSYGPRKAADGWRFELIFAAVEDPDAAFKGLPDMAAGVKPVVRGSVDLAAWSPLVQMFAGFAAMASPDGQKMLDQLKSSGMVGPDAIKIDYTLGHSADAMHAMYAVRRLGRHLEALAFTKATLTAEDLVGVPADASFVSASKMDVRKSWANMRKQLEQAGGQRFEEGYAEVKRSLGFDPEADLIHALGDTIVAYFADSTGGGSLMSGVMLVSLSDPAKLSGTLDKLASHANLLIEREVKPTPPTKVEIARFERDGIGYTQLRFPGLPVPIEPTLAVAGKWLIVGATPQAATAAAWHVKQMKAGGGILSLKAFAATGWDRAGGSIQATYVDPARTLRDGYTAMTMVSSAVANLVRSSIGAPAAREPGMVLPLYAELVKDARPLVSVSYWAGEDLVTEATGDRSVLVSLATIAGIGDAAPFIFGAITGGVIATEAARDANMGTPYSEPEEHQWEQIEGMGEEPADDEAMPAEGEEPAEKSKTPY